MSSFKHQQVNLVPAQVYEKFNQIKSCDEFIVNVLLEDTILYDNYMFCSNLGSAYCMRIVKYMKERMFHLHRLDIDGFVTGISCADHDTFIVTKEGDVYHVEKGYIKSIKLERKVSKSTYEYSASFIKILKIPFPKHIVTISQCFTCLLCIADDFSVYEMLHHIADSDNDFEEPQIIETDIKMKQVYNLDWDPIFIDTTEKLHVLISDEDLGKNIEIQPIILCKKREQEYDNWDELESLFKGVEQTMDFEIISPNIVYFDGSPGYQYIMILTMEGRILFAQSVYGYPEKYYVRQILEVADTVIAVRAANDHAYAYTHDKVYSWKILHDNNGITGVGLGVVLKQNYIAETWVKNSIKSAIS